MTGERLDSRIGCALNVVIATLAAYIDDSASASPPDSVRVSGHDHQVGVEAS
jgi:hypothetical protein